MSKDLSIRDALLELRQFVAGEPKRKARIAELSCELDKAVGDRLAAAERVVVTWTRLIGFDDALDGLLVETSAENSEEFEVAPTKGSTKKSVVKKKKASKSGVVVNGNYPNTIEPAVKLSPLEENVLEILGKKWPGFVTAKTLARKRVLGHHTHAAATISRMRKKGVPIESAKQARGSGADVTLKTTGYRLIE